MISLFPWLDINDCTAVSDRFGPRGCHDEAGISSSRALRGAAGTYLSLRGDHFLDMRMSLRMVMRQNYPTYSKIAFVMGKMMMGQYKPWDFEVPFFQTYVALHMNHSTVLNGRVDAAGVECFMI